MGRRAKALAASHLELEVSSASPPPSLVLADPDARFFYFRIWARTVWICTPDSMQKAPIEDPAERDADACRAVLEKVTVSRARVVYRASARTVTDTHGR